ncbi:MAG: S8 family serine peptidase [bacterium]
MIKFIAEHRLFACALTCACALLAARRATAADTADGRVRLLGRTIHTSDAIARSRASGKSADKLATARAGRTPQSLSARGTQPYLIQFDGHILPAWKLAVAAAGGTIRGYVPDNTLIVEAAPNRLDALSEIAAIQWIGEYEPADKLAPQLAAHVRAATSTNGLVAIMIALFNADDLDRVQSFVTAHGGRIDRAGKSSTRGLVRASMPPAGLAALAALGEVEWIEPFLPRVLLNNVAAQSAFMNVTTVWTNYGLNGAGQIVAVADTGLDTGDLLTIHPDFTNRVLATYALGRTNENDWSDPNGHGTHTSGSVLGDGSAYSNGLFRGIAWGARLVMQSIMDSNGRLSGLPDDLNTLFLQAYTNGARVHSDSWGASLFGYYDTSSRSADEFIWEHPDMLVLFSAGNSGRDVAHNGVISFSRIGTPGTSKNVLTVGAAESQRATNSGGYSSYTWNSGSWSVNFSTDPIASDYISTSADGVHQGMAAFSSRGPCNDGRIKPDIVAPGTDIISCRSRAPGAGDLWGTGSGVLADTNGSSFYVFCGGTSMSTPLTAGAAALARQFFMERRGMTNPTAALLKATLLNGARSLAPGQYGAGAAREIPDGPRPNPVEGWGQVNLAATLFPPAGLTNGFLDGDTLATGQTNSYTIVSTGSDMHSGIAGAIGALKGPLHGGANEQVLEVLAAIGSADRAEAWLESSLPRSAW